MAANLMWKFLDLTLTFNPLEGSGPEILLGHFFFFNFYWLLNIQEYNSKFQLQRKEKKKRDTS